MLEALVIALCIGDFECGEATRAYSKTTTGLEYTAQAKKAMGRYLNKEQITTLGTFIAAATNHKAKLRLYRGLTFEGNMDSVQLIYKYSF